MKFFAFTLALVFICAAVFAQERFLLPIKIDSKWGCLNQDARLVVQPHYDSAASLEYNRNYVAVRKNNLWGLVNSNAQVVLELQYAYLHSLTSEIVVFLNRNYRGHGIINLSTSQFIPAYFGSFHENYGKIRVDDFLSDTLNLDFKDGDSDNKLIARSDSAYVVVSNSKVSYIPLQYEPQRSLESNALYLNNIIIKFKGKMGMWNLETDTVSLAPEYDEIAGCLLRKGKQWWFVDSVFTHIVSYQQYDTILDSYGPCYILQKGTMQALFNARLKKNVIPPQNQVIKFHREWDNSKIEDFVYVTRSTGKGLFLLNGTELFPCKYKNVASNGQSSFSLETDSTFSLAQKKDGALFFTCPYKASDVISKNVFSFNEWNFYIATPTDFYWYKYKPDVSYSLFYKEPARCKIGPHSLLGYERVFDPKSKVYIYKRDTTKKIKEVTLYDYADSLRTVKFKSIYPDRIKGPDVFGNILSYYKDRNCELKTLKCFRDTMLYLIKKATQPLITNRDRVLPDLWYRTHWNALATGWFDHHTDTGVAFALGIASQAKGELLAPDNKLIMLEDFKLQNCARIMSLTYAFSLINKDAQVVRMQLTFIDEPEQGLFRFAESGELKCVANKAFAVAIPYHCLKTQMKPAALAVIGAQWGFMDTDGRDVFAQRYDFLSEPIGNYTRVFNRGKWGVIISISPHSITVPIKYDSVAYIAYMEYNNTNPGYSSRTLRFTFHGYRRASPKFVKVTLDNKHGICSISDGCEIIAPQYRSLKYFKGAGDGIFALQDSAGWWLYNTKGERISHVAYKSAEEMPVPDIFRVTTADGNIGVFSSSGKMLVEPCVYSAINYSNGFLVVEHNNSMDYFTLNGEPFFTSGMRDSPIK